MLLTVSYLIGKLTLKFVLCRNQINMILEKLQIIGERCIDFLHVKDR